MHTELLPTHIYAPLSQAMTDSDDESDEEIEIHNSSKHRRQQQQLHQRQEEHQQQQQQQQSQRNRSRIPPNTLALKSPHTRSNTVRKSKPPTTTHTQRQRFQLEDETPKSRSSTNTTTYTTNMQNTFRSVMLSDLGGGSNTGPGTEFSNFNSEFDTNGDNVAILGSSCGEEDLKVPMSTARRCCFIISLLICLFAIVGFVWLVPCGNPDGTGACPAIGDRVKTHNWLNNYTKIELKGGINVVSGLRAWENNLIFLYRGDAFFPSEFRPSNHRRNGIISLIGSSGAVAWYDQTVDEPVALDCTLLDIDGNSKNDCLVMDEYGELGAINPVSGQWHWRYKERSSRKVDEYDFPVILPDLDGDGVLDILLVSSLTLEQRTKALVQQQHNETPPSQLETRNVLRLLSGRHGEPIGDGFRLHECQKIARLQLEAGNVSFSCLRSNNTEQQRSKTLAELYALITNKSIVGQRLSQASKISQHRHHGQRREIEAQRNIYSLSGRELLVENRGKCPEDCNVTLVLSEMRNGKPFVLWNLTNSAMYGMVPAEWHFKNTKSKMSGFVMKFWEWHSINNRQSKATQSQTSSFSSSAPTQNNNVQKNNSNTNKNLNSIKDKEKTHASKKQQQQQQQQQQQYRLKRQAAPKEEFNIFDHLIEKREAYGMPYKNQTKSNSTASSRTGASTGSLTSPYKMQMITETVILVLFMGADTRIENTSQSNIVQFCRHDRSEVICQPDLTNQEHSMLIADLDQDGSQELVTYMSTFVQADEHEWKLVTYVRLLRIQSELPVYYEDEKHN